MWRISIVPALLVLAGVLAVGPPAADAKREKAPEIVEVEDGNLLRLHLADDEAAQGWLYRPARAQDPEQGPYDLIVGLHGAGGNPKNFLMQRVMDARRAWCLVVAGHQTVDTDRGKGFMWDGGNVSYIVAFVEYLLGKYPLAKNRVIVWGHSAGGTMTLATLGEAPKLFAGGLTTAAPRTPDSSVEDLRTCVMLGTTDPNFAGAPAVRSFVEKTSGRRSKGACAFFVVEGLGHEVPADGYLDLGFDWVLAGEARGGEATVGLEPKGCDGPWHHILVRYKGAEGAGDERRSKSKAQKLLKDVKKDLDKGKAFFPFEAACHSQDADTASCGGGIEEEALAALLGALPEIEPGAVSEVLESPQGVHLVWREAAEPEGD